MKISPESLTKLADLASGLMALVDEWKGEMGAEEKPTETPAPETPEEMPAEEKAPAPAPNLSESGAVWFVESADSATPPSTRDPLTLDVQLIRPGWGNARDKNFYSREVLQRDAKVFEGAKMYATDHVDAEKSVRTEVSRVDRIVGFSPTGAPIARVTVFDPAFAEAVRNRQKAGLLETLECSILAQGRTRSGEVEGQKGNIVESITAAHSVDWVTRAGAGGKALRLAENNAPAPSELAEADVKAVLEQTKLPPVSRAKVAAQKHATLSDLTAAVTAELAYLKEATGSGKPVNGFNTPAPASVNLAEVKKTQDAINKKFLA
jgi:hypothetical protein